MLQDLGLGKPAPLAPIDQATLERNVIGVLRNGTTPEVKLAAIAELLKVDPDDDDQASGTAPDVSRMGMAPTVAASRGRPLSLSSVAAAFAAAGWRGPAMSMSHSSVDDLSRLDRKLARGVEGLYLSTTGQKIKVAPDGSVSLSALPSKPVPVTTDAEVYESMRRDCGLRPR
jgi:hypothetical protein